MSNLFRYCYCFTLTPERDTMYLKKRLGKELLFLALTVAMSFLFWVTLAIITDQHITATQYLYIREQNAFFVTVGFFYFIRLIAWAVE